MSDKHNQIIADESPLYNLRQQKKVKKTKSGKYKSISQTDLGEILLHGHILTETERAVLEENGESKGIGKDTIGKWESGQYPDTNNLIKLADYFEVSTDYILGRDQSRNLGNKQISQLTGLSETSIEVLRSLNIESENSEDNTEHKKTIDFINLALEEKWEYLNGHYKAAPEEQSPVTTIFHKMMQYILSDNSELRFLDGDEYRIINSKIATLDIDGNPTGYTVSELSRELIINYLRIWLEEKREEFNNGIHNTENN